MDQNKNQNKNKNDNETENEKEKEREKNEKEKKKENENESEKKNETENEKEKEKEKEKNENENEKENGNESEKKNEIENEIEKENEKNKNEKEKKNENENEKNENEKKKENENEKEKENENEKKNNKEKDQKKKKENSNLNHKKRKEIDTNTIDFKILFKNINNKNINYQKNDKEILIVSLTYLIHNLNFINQKKVEYLKRWTVQKISKPVKLKKYQDQQILNKYNKRIRLISHQIIQIIIDHYQFYQKELKDESNNQIFSKNYQDCNLLIKKKNFKIINFIKIINNNDWKYVMKKHLQSIQKKFEKKINNKLLIEKILNQSKNKIINLFKFEQENNNLLKNSFNSKNQKLKTQMKKNKVISDQYLIKETKFISKQQKKNTKIWFNLFTKLLRENSLLINNDMDIYNWKLDFTEDKFRRRLRLIKYYKPSRFKEASIRRDNKTKIEINSKIEEWNENERVKTIKRVSSSKILNANFLLHQSIYKTLPNNNNTNDGKINANSNNSINNGDDNGNEKKKVFLKMDCSLISIKGVNNGVIILTNKTLEFNTKPSKFNNVINSNQSTKKIKQIWQINQLLEIRSRTYYYKSSSIEIFLSNKKNYFLNFNSNKDRKKILKKILYLKPKNLKYFDNGEKPLELLKKSGITKRWLNREISNFDYLMKLNTFAGRTFNDLSQYPIFPWIISNYETEKLDLNDIKNYRDLSKPVGIINPDHTEILQLKYESMKGNEEIPPFHHGTHYSVSAGVMYFLIRLEPFTSREISLHDGKFDNPDRIFRSIQRCWNNIINSLTFVRELIPEFYYLPEFLINNNQLDLGVSYETKERVNGVQLPPWAKGSAEEFIKTNKDALESEYVSAHLHEWIDLIFGYKARGEEAVRATNVFYHYTYEDNVDLDSIQDPVQQEIMKTQIESYGQCPTQLFVKPHPKRLSHQELEIEKKINKYNYNYNFQLNNLQLSLKLYKITSQPIKYLKIFNINNESNLGGAYKLFLIDKNRNYYLYSVNYTKRDKQFLIEKIHSSSMNQNHQQQIGVPFCSRIKHNTVNCYSVNKNCKIIYSCGYWDDSLLVHSIENGKLLQSITSHRNVVTCLSHHKNVLITGSRDTTIRIWELDKRGGTIKAQSESVLYGHSDEITCLDLNVSLDVAVSASKDGTLIIHSIIKKKIMRRISFYSPISFIKITNHGQIITYSKLERRIRLLSINGKLLEKRFGPYVDSLIYNPKKDLLYTIAENELTIRNVHMLTRLGNWEINGKIGTFDISENNQVLICGREDGQILFSPL
ncbi:beige/beach-related [Anaeramoeba flamelloides]|uniref:Beige/beach-related n=1 Tax=Anaeramoeba flamelloides TaxID=1746091 RepID=A0ABQ8ZCA6_9EUKA|nr:beige/beach-related [Anaeramoeba flamelloides]